MGDTGIQQRTILWYFVFVGFAVNYMIRINLNITIVDMVKPNLIMNDIQKIDHDNHSSSNSNVTSLSEINNSIVSDENSFIIEQFLLDKLNINYEKNGFSWNQFEQGLVLGAFYWIHWITQIPGGILSKKYGTKLIFGLSNVIGCWMCCLLPFASYFGYKSLIILRCIQGLVCGLSWPAMHHMTAQWIPPNERSKFVSAYLGSSVGIAVFYPLFGYVIHWSSWEWVFHICGFVGTVWYIGWLLFVFDTPADHPRITQSELRYIQKSLGNTVQSKTVGPIPWKEILTSKAVWVNVIAQWGGIWGLFTLMTQAPTYFRVIHNWNIKMTGMLSGFPHLLRMIFALFFSFYADYLLRTEKMSRTNVRKLATSICCIVKGLFVLCLAYSGSSAIASVIFLTIATTVHGTVSSGPLASCVDLSPNYAGIVLGISGMVGVLPGFLSPVIVGQLTLGNQTIESWKYVFLISSAMLIISGIVYNIFCDSTLQSWNDPNNKKDASLEKELESLKPQKEDFNKNGKIIK